MVEATGVEPVSEKQSMKFSPGAAFCLCSFSGDTRAKPQENIAEIKLLFRSRQAVGIPKD